MALAILGNGLILTRTHANLLLDRSFYGTLKIRLKKDKAGVPYHLFIHGSTRHNLQKFADDGSGNQEPLMYFHRHANIGQMMRALKSHLGRPMQLGFVGLGAGAMSAYVEEGDTAAYYEIDPKVVAMASNPEYFTYLSAASGAISIIVGDARLQLKKAADHSFDLLLIDAFASDAIPVHLLTAEAVGMYLHKLKDEGVLAFHLSNRYLALAKVVQGMVLPSGYALYYASNYNVEQPAEAEERIASFFSHSQVAIIAKEAALPEAITASARWLKLEHEPGFSSWTDDFSNVLGVLKIW
jgi:spermidine synthase